jgi:hypothetical protein
MQRIGTQKERLKFKNLNVGIAEMIRRAVILKYCGRFWQCPTYGVYPKRRVSVMFDARFPI